MSRRSGSKPLAHLWWTLVLSAALVASGSAALAAASSPPAWVTTAKAQLAELRVRVAAPMVGYDRDKFGPAWKDVDHNGCDTRNDILKRDLTRIVFRSGSNCVVSTGVLRDPYTGRLTRFVRGVGSSNAVQIDHVVALADAWRTGAARWTAARRLRYANDRVVLLAVDGPQNESKGDDDASEWLPPRTPYDCRYVAKQVTIKTKYTLWVTRRERNAMAGVLASWPRC
jgi:hypothetical protein